MEMTKNDTKMLQGLAVMAMLMLHLFDRVEYQGLFQPLIFIKNIPLSFYIAQLSDFCVFCFAFCSGYAHMKLYNQSGYYRKRMKGLMRLLIQYWTIIIVFSIIAFLIGETSFMPGNLKTFAGNAFMYKISYNGAWWYMWVYTLIVLISPVILYICKAYNPLLVMMLGFIVYCAAYYVRFNLSSTSFILEKFGPFGMTLFEYIIGCVCCHTKYFTVIYQFWLRIRLGWRCLMTIVIIIGLLLLRTLIVPSLFFAPYSGFLVITLFHFWKKPEIIKKIFVFIGEHSTNIWLTHMFFYVSMFRGLVYLAKYPLLIFGFMLILTIGISYVLKYIENPLLKYLK